MNRAELLRSRLLAVLGAGTLYALGTSSSADTGEPSEGTLCMAWTESEVCPGAEEARPMLDAVSADDCPVQSVDGEGVYAEGTCCYPVTVAWCSEDSYGYTKCSCYGRPYVADGQPLTADSVPERRWAEGPRPSAERLSPAERAALARKWAADGLAEHSSVAGFARFALELMALGAPPELVQRAMLAGAQETGHARLCFALASAYAGAPVGPSALPLGGSAPLAQDLVALATATAREGALGETLAAYAASEALFHATDPAVREVLAKIVEEETQHAELAWATLRWATAAGGAPVREAVAAALNAPLDPIAEEGPHLPDHGLLSAAARQRAREVGLRRIIRPALAALLGEPMEAGLSA